MDYIFLQKYWWFLISLLAAILVFLMFVQGGNSLLFSLGKSEEERRLLANSTGRKWEFTFTTLVVFGGGFFASFPLFYSTSFGGAYWVWMIILFTFVLQAVSYEFQSKLGNLLGKRVYRSFLIFNGIFGPFLLGCAVATFFTGSNFYVDKSNIGDQMMPIISGWTNNWHGLDILFNPWNLIFGFAVLYLSRVLGSLYLINNLGMPDLVTSCRKQLRIDGISFVVFFIVFIVYVMLKEGFAVDPSTGDVYMEKYKYFFNMIDMPIVFALFIFGVVLVLYGIFVGAFVKKSRDGIWFAGAGTILTVLSLMMCVGYNDTAYYPSLSDINSSLTIQNSSSSQFTLGVMSYVSLLIPVVLIYIFYAWRKIDKSRITEKELDEDSHVY